MNHSPGQPNHKRQTTLRSVVLVLLMTSIATSLTSDQVFAAKTDTVVVKRGELVYQQFCSLCHGVRLEGQPDWRKRKPDGKLPAPPHDETGHTWHHADDLLFGMIKQGMVPPYAPANYKSDMPALGNILKDEDIWAVLAFIKSRWPEKTRKLQAQRNKKSQQWSN